MIRCIDSIDGKPIFEFLEVTEIKTVPYVPLSHPLVERLIGTIRREYLDRILFWGTADLEAKLPTAEALSRVVSDPHRRLNYELAMDR
jgi:hypothetical protein